MASLLYKTPSIVKSDATIELSELSITKPSPVLVIIPLTGACHAVLAPVPTIYPPYVPANVIFNLPSDMYTPVEPTTYPLIFKIPSCG